MSRVAWTHISVRSCRTVKLRPKKWLPSPVEPAAAANALESWFGVNARDLPWRRTYDPYHVLVSEFILQQTRVETGTAYFEAFVRRFPSIQALARAREQSVLRAWSGLGYYRRGRNLHQSAKRIVRSHGGSVPRARTNLLALPGIGPYTAGAVASIAYEQPEPSIDGNQRRVISRLLGLDNIKGAAADRRIHAWATHALASASPRAINQALMDLGSQTCTPRAPKCTACPLSVGCRSAGNVKATPRRGAATRKAVEHWEANVVIRNGSAWLRPPKGTGLLGDRWLPPMRRLRHVVRIPDVTHVFSHKSWRIRVRQGQRRPRGPGRWVACSDLSSVPTSKLTLRLLEAAQR